METKKFSVFSVFSWFTVLSYNAFTVHGGYYNNLASQRTAVGRCRSSCLEKVSFDFSLLHWTRTYAVCNLVNRTILYVISVKKRNRQGREFGFSSAPINNKRAALWNYVRITMEKNLHSVRSFPKRIAQKQTCARKYINYVLRYNFSKLNSRMKFCPENNV